MTVSSLSKGPGPSATASGGPMHTLSGGARRVRISKEGEGMVGPKIKFELSLKKGLEFCK